MERGDPLSFAIIVSRSTDIVTLLGHSFNMLYSHAITVALCATVAYADKMV